MHQKYMGLKRELIILKYCYKNISKHICDVVIYVFYGYIQQQDVVIALITTII